MMMMMMSFYEFKIVQTGNKLSFVEELSQYIS